jgi:TPR repeat protein
MYDNGQGVEKDFLKAFEWYRRAAEQDYPQAQFNLGVMYDNGQGVEKDYKKAFEWYKQAAILGNPIAQCMLGKCYKYGYGIEINEETALSWFFKAYEQEEPDSLFLIADSYISSGPMQDQRKAVEWSEKNYSKDNLLSAITLGYCYDAFCLKEKLLSCAQAWLDNINLRWLGNLILADMYQSGEAGNAIDSVKAYEYCRLAIEDFNLEPEESFTYEFAKLLIDEASSHMRNLHNDDINSKLTEVDYKAAQMDVLRRVEPSSALFKVIKSFPLILKKTLNKMSTKSDLLIGQDPVETAIWKNLMEWNSDRAKFQTFCVNKAKLEGVHYDYSSSSDYSRKREASIILRKAESIGTLDIESDKGLSEIIDAAYPRASDKRKNRIFNDVRSRQAGRMFSLEAQMQDSSNTVSDSVENNLFHSTSDISVFRSTEEEVFQQEGTLNMVENLLSDLDKAYPARSDFNKAMYSCIVFIILINGTDLPVEQIERFLSETKHFNANIEGIKKYVLSTMRHGSIIEQAKVCEMLEVHQSQYSRARNDLVSKISNSIAKNKEDI